MKTKLVESLLDNAPLPIKLPPGLTKPHATLPTKLSTDLSIKHLILSVHWHGLDMAPQEASEVITINASKMKNITNDELKALVLKFPNLLSITGLPIEGLSMPGVLAALKCSARLQVLWFTGALDNVEDMLEIKRQYPNLNLYFRGAILEGIDDVMRPMVKRARKDKWF